jgi:hypothetical protein
MEIRSRDDDDDGDDDDDDASWQEKGGGADVATRTASPGIICSPELLKESTRVLSRCLRCLLHPLLHLSTGYRG